MNLKSVFQFRDKRIVVIDGWFGNKFSDNSRFLFQYLSDNKVKLGLSHVVWVSHNDNVVKEIRKLGYEAYNIDSEESIKFHKSAKYHICNNSPYSYGKYSNELLCEYSYGAKRINLWHGVAVVKGLGYEAQEYINEKKNHTFSYNVREFLITNSSFFRKIFLEIGNWGDCYYLAPSVEERDKMKKEFLLPNNRYIISGYPRNCTCDKNTDFENEVIDILKSNKKNIIYMPTFRTGSNDFDFRNVGKNLHDTLVDNGILWIQKGHSADKHTEGYVYKNNILSLPDSFDTNVIMPFVDAVVTDYSSAMMDGLYHFKPVLLYVPDFDEFKSGERGLVPDAEVIMTGCGYLYKDISRLSKGIVSAVNDPDSAKPENYLYTREKYWGKERTCEEIWNDILKAVG